MQIGISTASFYPMEIERGIANAAKLGFTEAELFINSESEYVYPLRESLKNELDFLGIHVVSVHPYTSAMEGHLLFSDYTRRTQDALEQYQRYFAAAAALGATYFTFHGELLRSRGLPPEKADENRFQTYRALCERAKTEGIVFTQENVSWCKSADLNFLKALKENVPELSYTLDLKQAYRARVDWERYVETVGDRIVNLHISDYDAQSDCLLPGQGAVDFVKLFTEMEQLDYQGGAMIEVYSDDYAHVEQLQQSKLYLEDLQK